MACDNESGDGLVMGRRVQWDASGVGHCWRDVDACDVPEEVAAEIVSGGVEECDDYLAGNGQHYRWF